MSLLKYERTVMQMVLKDRRYVFLLVLLSAVFTAIYLVLLPSLPNGTINPLFIKFITPTQIIFSFIFGIMISLMIVLNIYAAKLKIHTSKGGPIVGVIGTLVNALCCTPIIPALLAFLGASTPVLFAYSPHIQAFFEHNYPYFYVISLLIFLAAFHYTAKNIFCCKRD
ncbi:hypothetical protein M1397_02280 [Candidatus Marsarchaeota archaeon]|nr:hypothetical protein [Candidatus Marsarchaeota archaeon]